MSFPSTCFHQAQVCRSIIPQLLSPLMELSTNKFKILRSGHTPLLQSPALLLPTLAEHSLFLAISFFRASNQPLYSFLPSIIFLLSRFSLLLYRPASFNQYSSRTNANKHLRIHHHLQVLVHGGYIKLGEKRKTKANKKMLSRISMSSDLRLRSFGHENSHKSMVLIVDIENVRAL